MRQLVMISAEDCEVCNKWRPIAKQACDVKNIRFVEYTWGSKESESFDINGIPQFALMEDGVVIDHGVGERGLIQLNIIPSKW
jgi:hypothetical protein